MDARPAARRRIERLLLHTSSQPEQRATAGCISCSCALTGTGTGATPVDLFGGAATWQREVETTVPRWLFGCWKRKIITFAERSYNGRLMPFPTDDTSEVVWLQTARRCGDLRLNAAHPGHPIAAHSLPRSLVTATKADLAAMAEGDGWLGCCRVDVSGDANIQSAAADWFEDEACAGLPTRSKFPEPGEIRRVGESLLEFAPSGAYVEDWRLEAGSDCGLSASLVLLTENGAQPDRGVHLVMSGNHAILVRDRHPSCDLSPYTKGPLSEFDLEVNVRRMLKEGGRREEVEMLLDFECSYAVRDCSKDFRVRASTLPFQVTPLTSCTYPSVCFLWSICSPLNTQRWWVSQVGTSLPSWEGAVLHSQDSGVTAVDIGGRGRAGIGTHVHWQGRISQPSAQREWGVESWDWL